MLTRIGIIGCGQISRAYLKTLTDTGAGVVEVAACADLREEAARERVAESGIARVLSVDELLSDPDINLIANLTIPEAHADLNRAALLAGKHVYTEKPLALTMAEARELHAIATTHGLMLSCAPDTLLGDGPQRTRHLVESGLIGEPVSAFGQIFMGNTRWRRYLRHGVGPWLDMGPYYIGALVHLLGPVLRASGLGTRPQLAHPEHGPFIPDEPARAGAVLEFASGPLALLSAQSFGPAYAPRLEIFGDRGTLACPDPNIFDGDFLLDAKALPATGRVTPFEGKSLRGAGMIEMAQALQAGRDCRLNADFSLHCAEVLLAVHQSIATGQAVTLSTRCAKPPLLLESIQS